jgi:hypothetical protein
MTPSDNPKMVAVAQSLGFEKKEAKLFLQLMARFAEIEMPFWKAVENAIILVIDGGTCIAYTKEIEKT